MARNAHDGNAGNNLHVAIDELPLPRFADGNKTVREIAGAVALASDSWRVRVRARCTTYCALGKAGTSRPVEQSRVSAGMIEMQMRVDDHIDVFSAATPARASESVKRIAFRNAINVAQLGVPLGSVAGLHQNSFARQPEPAANWPPAECDCVRRRALSFPKVSSAPHRTSRRHRDKNLRREWAELQSHRNASGLAPDTQAAPCKNFIDGGERIFAALGHVAMPIRPAALLPAGPPSARSSNRDSSSSIRRFFQCSTCFFCRSGRDAKCSRNLATVSASASTPRFSDATVRTTGGCQPCCGITSESMACSCCSTRSAPSRSLLLTTKMSRDFHQAGLHVLNVVAHARAPPPRSTQSASRTMSISSWPTPTVSIRICRLPAASSSSATSDVAARQAAEKSARGHRANEHARIRRVALHANAVA